jgi:hypothetical protein
MFSWTNRFGAMFKIKAARNAAAIGSQRRGYSSSVLRLQPREQPCSRRAPVSDHRGFGSSKNAGDLGIFLAPEISQFHHLGMPLGKAGQIVQRRIEIQKIHRLGHPSMRRAFAALLSDLRARKIDQDLAH